jgi:RNA-directed DNA polymerase
VTDFSPHLYRLQGRELGLDTDLVRRSSAEIERLRHLGLRPLLTLNHLAQLTGCNYDYLRATVERSADPYTGIKRKKRDGTFRSLSSPNPPLMGVQRWILREILRSVELHEASFAYRENRSIVDCASRHVGAKWLIKLDLHDFFGSVSENRVYRVFRELGYPALISFELARLCTRRAMPWNETFPSDGKGRGYSSIPSYTQSGVGYLPQGAPTSGALANAVTAPLDRELADFARGRSLVYTRYSDDLTFSAGQEFSRRDAVEVLRQVGRTIAFAGFQIHEKKTRIVPPGARQVVLGLLIGDDDVRLLPKFRRRLQWNIRAVARFGLVEHARRQAFDSVLSFVNHVDGCIAFSYSVEPEFAAKARRDWSSALARAGMPQL